MDVGSDYNGNCFLVAWQTRGTELTCGKSLNLVFRCAIFLVLSLLGGTNFPEGEFPI